MAQSENQYYNIAEEYKDSKQLPFRKYVEEYSLFQMLGDIRGKTIIDLACGDGFYTRKLKMAGAKEVIGVDLSPEMIQLAEAEEKRRPLGCVYLCQDASELQLPKVDLVVAAYLLNNAKTKEQLLQFCQTAHSILRPNGSFVSVNDNIKNTPFGVLSLPQYGLERKCPDPPQEGDTITYTITNPDGKSFKFKNTYLSPQTYQWAFREAGFANFEWKAVELNPSQANNPDWESFMSTPPIIGLMAN